MSYRPFSPSLFGPYRKFYEDKLKQLNTTERASLSQVSEEDTNISETNIEKEAKEGRRNKTDYTAFHKKQNVKFFKDSDSRRTDRMSVYQESIKQKRTQILMDRRKCQPMATAQDNDKLANSIGNINEQANCKMVKESRKEQLLRWKKEKEAASVMANKKAASKPPFKSGQINKPTVVAKGTVLDANFNHKTRIANPATRPGSAITDAFTFVAQNSNNAGAPRRVTRAMSKAQSGTIPTIRAPVAPVNKMQSLTISNKNKTQALGNVPKKDPVLVPMDVAKVGVEIKTAEVVVPTRAPKKPKPKAIDNVYIDFISIFSEACKDLRRHLVEWKNVVEWPDIPELVREDITCYIGQANLLLASKLPQFHELLNSYLCPAADSCPILPCDLQGWWDVAAIQVEAVKSKFEKLKELQKNKWIPVVAAAPVSKLVLAHKSENKLPVEGRRKSVQASKGIRDFLAKKRQLAAEPPTTVKKADTCKNITPEKKFEGGFFAVNSPVKPVITPRMATRLSILKESPMTPSRKSSSTNVSLRMLSVRKSMGSICKIGVVQNYESTGDQ